uniref:glucuronosyltransferase n=1 Tax=Acrobeloides nanus TaxID=290746 RepID=A0A914E7W3_9BILA
MHKLSIAVIFGLIIFSNVECLKIFIFAPTFGYSHILFAGRIADVLIDGGHNVTILQPSFDPDVTEPGTDRAKTIFFTSKNIDYSVVMNMSSKTSAVFYPGRNTGADVVTLFKVKRQLCEDLLDEKDLIAELRNEKFDVGMTEFIDYCGDGFLETIGIDRQITLSAVTFFEPIYDTFGLPKLASFVPHLLLPFSDQMNWKQKLINLFVHYKIDGLYREHVEAETEIFRRKFKEDMEDLLTIRKRKTAMAFLNIDENLEIPPLMTTKIRLIGGIKPRNIAPIPESLLTTIQKYKGFVLLSFGTFARASMIPSHIQEALMKTFEKFPDFLFLWKHDLEKDETLLKSGNTNFLPMKWLPQYALLRKDENQWRMQTP